MTSEEIIVTGYWNKERTNWVLSKERSSDKDEVVVISIETLPKTKDSGKGSLKEFERSAKKISKELRGFVRDLKKIR